MISSNKKGSLNYSIYVYVKMLTAILHPTVMYQAQNCLGMMLVILREALAECNLSRMEEHTKSSPPLIALRNMLSSSLAS